MLTLGQSQANRDKSVTQLAGNPHNRQPAELAPPALQVRYRKALRQHTSRTASFLLLMPETEVRKSTGHLQVTWQRLHITEGFFCINRK